MFRLLLYKFRFDHLVVGMYIVWLIWAFLSVGIAYGGSPLEDELANDPLGRGYSGMTDQQITDSLNALTRTRERTTMSSGEIMEHINSAEFIALGNAAKSRVDRVLGLGAEVIIGPGNIHNAVQELLGAFGGGSTTISNLATARSVAISRAQELGISGPKVGHVEDARP